MKLILVCCLLSLLGMPAWAQPPTISTKTQQQIDSLFAPYNKAEGPGFALGIFTPTTMLLSKGYGMANLDYNLPNSSHTVYNIASLSKQFTAACVALLILRNIVVPKTWTGRLT